MKTQDVMFSLEKQIEGITRKMNAVTYNAMAQVIQRIDQVSPVGDVNLWSKESRARAPIGYRGGQFRGNWQLGVDSKPMGALFGRIDPTGISTVGENIGKIPVAASRHKYYLVNNLPYAIFLEQGHSTQAPPHQMVYRIKREFNSIVRKVVEDIKANGGRVK